MKSVQWKYLLVEAGLLILFCYLFLFAGFTDVFYNVDVLWVLTGIVTVTGVLLLVAKKPGPLPLRLPLLIFFVSCIISTLFSIDPRRSVDQLFFFALTLFVFFASVQLVRSGVKEELIGKTILVAGFLTTFVEFLNVVFWYRQWLNAMPGQLIPTIAYRLPSSNIVIMFLNPLLFLIISTFFSTRTRFWKITMILYALFVVFMIYLTSSRGGWLGTAAGLLCLILLSGKAGWMDWRRVWNWWKQHKIAWLVTAISIIILVAAGVYLISRQTIQPTHRVVSEARVEFWPPAWQTFLKYPLIGQGLFTFNVDLLQTQSVPPFKIFVHAHDIPLNTLAETGILGEIALLILVVSLIVAFWRKFFKDRMLEHTLPMAAVAAFTGACVHGLFDCYNQPFGFWLVVILVGCALAKPKPTKSRWYDRPYWLVLFIPIVWLNLWLVNSYNKGMTNADAKEYPVAISVLQQTASFDPFSAAAHQQLALAYSMDQNHVQDAIQQLEKTIDLDPNWALNYANLGALYAQAGEPSRALEMMSIAEEKAPDCALFHLNIGYLQEQAGNVNEAQSEYAAYINMMPEFAESEFWSATTVRQEVYEDWLRNNPHQDLTLPEALDYLANNPNDLAAYLQVSELEMTAGDIRKAEDHLSLATMVYTTRPWELMDVYWMQARIAASKGDLGTAINLAETALDFYRYQDVGGPGNLHGMLYINLVFRKPAMKTVLVPSLIKNPFPNQYGPYMEELSNWYTMKGDSSSAEVVKLELLQYIPGYQFRSQP